MKTILVTGASGSLGQAAVAALTARGFRVRAASRRPQPSSTPAVHNVRFDYADSSTHQATLQGVDGLLLIATPLDVDAPAKLNPVIDLAKALGVGQVVLNSALGVDADENAPLRRIERHLMASGLNYTILRPNFFMENFTTGFLAPMVRAGEIFLAAADARTSLISAQDIAAVAAEAFAGAHQGREYNLTGPEALDHNEVARLISTQFGSTKPPGAPSSTSSDQRMERSSNIGTSRKTYPRKRQIPTACSKGVAVCASGGLTSRFDDVILC